MKAREVQYTQRGDEYNICQNLHTSALAHKHIGGHALKLTTGAWLIPLSY